MAEGRNPVVLYHATPAKNVPSILKHGLIPRHGGGNYTDEMTTIGGVYGATTPREAYSIVREIYPDDQIAIVEIVADALALKADEDNIIYAIQKAIEREARDNPEEPQIEGIVDAVKDELEESGIKFNQMFISDLYDVLERMIDDILEFHSWDDHFAWEHGADLWLREHSDDVEMLFSNTWMDPKQK
ncbi:MAG: hypothetical protein D6698_15640, partial [Gammaproteobacteria bacterium]